MFILFVLVVLALFLYAFVQIVRGCLLLCKAMYYSILLLLNKERLIDKGYEKHVIKPSKDYKKFEKGFDEKIEGLINSKKIKF